MSSIERRQIEVRGIVQGVGFRPFVYRSAVELSLSGWVRNTGQGVLIDAQGEPCAIEALLSRIARNAPPLARVAEVKSRVLAPSGDRGFAISSSAAAAERAALIPQDTAPCDECLAEMLDPANRRFRYPFINCVNCGPRYTIAFALPYDRPNTTMLQFEMCERCAAEYGDPSNRRFHAQPNACSECGPRLWLARAADGCEIPCDDPISSAAEALLRGEIAAIKGVGGFHLACSALRQDVVEGLRERKKREAKPFALMVRDLEAARALCEISDAEASELNSPSRPIVLLRRRDDAHVASSCAPSNKLLGLMLPSSPLHQLLMLETDIPLVMTSGNLSDEPIAFRNDEALLRLRGIADLMLLHDRGIQVPCDDSIVRVIEGRPVLMRRSRGRTIEALSMPLESSPLMAMGGDLKGSIALAEGKRCLASQHLGDLSSLESEDSLKRTAFHLRELTRIQPTLIAHDLHPDYASTRIALELAGEGIPLVAVQHHHAHVAACMAEHGLPNEKIIGIALDGAGLGTDKTIWGGEIMVVDYVGFERALHLRCVPQPGGDAAAREPWRMAISYLMDAYGANVCESQIMRALPFANEIGEKRIHVLMQTIALDVQCTPTSSCGRLFDAVAAIIGLRAVNRFEGEAAMQLEQAACDRDCGRYEFLISDGEIDFRPMIRGIAEDMMSDAGAGLISARFHATVAAACAEGCAGIRTHDQTLRRVCLSGGCMQNALLATKLRTQLEQKGFEVFMHSLIPPNDGGIALGQAAVAAAKHRRP